MKKLAIILIAVLSLSSCASALFAPKPRKQAPDSKLELFGDEWSCGFQIIENAMPGANSKPYAILSLYREEEGQTFAWLKAERIWFYRGDSLISSSSQFEQGFQVLNQDNLSFVIREVPSTYLGNLNAVIRLRNSWGLSYTLRFTNLSPNRVYWSKLAKNTGCSLEGNWYTTNRLFTNATGNCSTLRLA